MDEGMLVIQRRLAAHERPDFDALVERVRQRLILRTSVMVEATLRSCHARFRVGRAPEWALGAVSAEG